jgi:hypothetical protein
MSGRRRATGLDTAKAWSTTTAAVFRLRTSSNTCARNSLRAIHTRVALWMLMHAVCERVRQ